MGACGRWLDTKVGASSGRLHSLVVFSRGCSAEGAVSWCVRGKERRFTNRWSLGAGRVWAPARNRYIVSKSSACCSQLCAHHGAPCACASLTPRESRSCEPAFAKRASKSARRRPAWCAPCLPAPAWPPRLRSRIRWRRLLDFFSRTPGLAQASGQCLSEIALVLHLPLTATAVPCPQARSQRADFCRARRVEP